MSNGRRMPGRPRRNTSNSATTSFTRSHPNVLYDIVSVAIIKQVVNKKDMASTFNDFTPLTRALIQKVKEE
jgi:hypothetical protein